MTSLKIDTIVVDLMTLKVSNKFIDGCGSYAVHDNKVWRVVQKERRDGKLLLGMSRPSADEKKTIMADDTVRYVLEPTGYIHC